MCGDKDNLDIEVVDVITIILFPVVVEKVVAIFLLLCILLGTPLVNSGMKRDGVK